MSTAVLIVTSIGVVAAVLGAWSGCLPRSLRCPATVDSGEYGTVRCVYREGHMQGRHFWEKKEGTARSSVEWVDDETATRWAPQV